MLLNKPPQEVYEAFIRLKGNVDFEKIVAWYRKCKEVEEACYDAVENDAKLRQSQGRHQAINAWIEANDEARERLQTPPKGK